MIDIETSTHKGHFYGHSYETDIVEIIEYGKILTFAIKPLGKKVLIYGWPDTRGERGLMLELRRQIAQYDVLIGHNIKKFDSKWWRARFLKYEIPPIKNKLYDTLTEFRKYIQLPSYSLDNVADYLGLGHKIHIEGHRLANQCLAGNSRAWRDLKKYNAWDDVLTEKIYRKILPWSEKEREWMPAKSCVKCGGNKLVKRGFGWSNSQRYQILTCRICNRRNRGEITS